MTSSPKTGPKHNTQEFIKFCPPNIGEEEISGVVECLRSGWLTSGPKVREFEQQFTDFIGNGCESISVNSATSGLFLTLDACGVGPGDEVITTPYTFSSTVMNIIHLGATPVLVDIDHHTLNITADTIEKAITPKTKAIIPVHMAGLACDMSAIIALAKKHHLRVIEDAAHTLPSTSGGVLIGAQESDATVYSFYATKTITTGEGGMVVTKDAELAKRIRQKRLHGISKDVFDRYTATTPKWYYEVTAQGYKCNMTDIAAAIGIGQLKQAHAFHQRRSDIAKMYQDGLKDLPLHRPAEAPDGDIHSWHLYIIKLADNAPVSREAFIERMSHEFHIGCSVHFIPIHHHAFWQQRLDIDELTFPNATRAFENAVSLPLNTVMTDNDVQRVIAATRTILTTHD